MKLLRCATLMQPCIKSQSPSSKGPNDKRRVVGEDSQVPGRELAGKTDEIQIVRLRSSRR